MSPRRLQCESRSAMTSMPICCYATRRSRRPRAALVEERMFPSWRLAVLCAFTIAAVSGVHAQDDPVRVEGGLIAGTRGADTSIHVFKGISFAAPPVGAGRWMPPQPVTPWSGVRKTDAFSPMCMQPQRPPEGSNLHDGTPETISEDCLYLNVWTPVAGTLAASEKRPVMVWIYGGLFRVGSAATGLFNGEALARKGIVFVSFNYRVGPLGIWRIPTWPENPVVEPQATMHCLTRSPR